MNNNKEKEYADYKLLIDERVEDLYELAPCGYITLLPNGTIVKINQTLLSWLGYERVEVLYEKKFQDFLPIGGKIFYETHYAPLLKMQGFINEINFDLLTNDTKRIPVLVNTIQQKGQDGIPVLYRATIFNITDRKKYEVELLQAKRKAEEATQIKAEFISTISHEIRTPMNAIIGIADLLLKTNPLPNQLEYLTILKLSSDNLLRLINNILVLSKIEAGQVTLENEDFNIRELLTSVLYNIKFKAEEKGLALHLQVDKSLPDILVGDVIKIGQVLTNLLGNAIKFTEHGSIVLNVTVEHIKDDTVSVSFNVIDTGIGIPREREQQIFEEFTQASSDTNLKYGGTGLGLSISQKILGLYGKKIKVKSKLGKGSEFSFNLKLKKGRIDKTAVDEIVLAKEESIAGVKLLVVDDNPINIFLVEQYLKEWGVEYEVAESGLQAIEKINQHDFDLVLMDLHMPGMDGYDTTRIIRNSSEPKYQHLAIIAFSASAKCDLIEKMESFGLTDFVSKPFKPEDLYHKIAYYSSHKRNSLKDEILPKQPVLLQPAPAKSASAFNINNCKELTQNSNEDFKELADALISSLEEFKMKFANTLKTNNKDDFKFLVHKMLINIHLLQAAKLQEFVSAGMKRLDEPEQHDIDLELLIEGFETEISNIIHALKEEIIKQKT